MEFKILKADCKRCKHSWIPRKGRVFVCPKCHSALWDIEPDSKSKVRAEKK